MNSYKKHAIIIGTLFIITMLAGMIDAYLVLPFLREPFSNNFHVDRLLLGVFSVLTMAIGIVLISIAFFPIIKKQSEIIALIYVIFRTIECFLLIVGPICYLLIISMIKESKGVVDSSFLSYVMVAVKIKLFCYQIAMIVLGLGSIFLCYSLYKSRVVPSFISIWGGIGYLLLLISAVLDIFGVIDTSSGLGLILYIPGGVWEFFILPLWLLIKGFNLKNYIPSISNE